MTPKTEQEFREKYPQIFRNLGGDPKLTCMAWGLEIGSGWHKLLDECCAKIMARNPSEHFQAEQVKEKFGGLRFYVSGTSQEIDDIIDAAERESYETCERCGSKDDVESKGSWTKTLCKKCRE